MKYVVTMKDIKKYEVLQQLIKKQIKGYQAACLLGYTRVHICRLKRKLTKYGFKGLLRPGRPSPRKKIAKLYKSLYPLSRQAHLFY